MVGWGSDSHGQADPPAGLSGVVAISAGARYSLALKADGTVVGWGYDYFDQASPPAGLSGVVAISAGRSHSLALVVNINPPVADAGGPYLGAVSTDGIVFDGTDSSDLDGDTLTYAWTFGDGNTGTGSTPTHYYTYAEIYDVCLTVNDGTVNSEEVCTIAVIYDPTGGFVTGGGWTYSAAGAYVADPTLEGKANFGFVSKYKKGASVPTGNTEFYFKTGDLNFHSSSYDWLVVTGSDFAKFKGTGTINGEGEYKFMLWAGDKEPDTDTFRIKIWYEENGSEDVVYDNGMDQEIGGGNIVVHTKK